MIHIEEEKELKNGTMLPLVEDFYTIQGEGFNMGKAAYFIRIGGCDIGCQWCDTKFSWNPGLHALTPVEKLAEKALDAKAKAIVVTGGEPSLYNLAPLCNILKQHHIETFIETSGAYPLTGQWDWICLSPKNQNPPLQEYYTKAHELKVIIENDNDYEWAEYNAKLVNGNCFLYLQPEWSKHEHILPGIIAYVKNNTKWRISLQAHKYMHIP